MLKINVFKQFNETLPNKAVRFIKKKKCFLESIANEKCGPLHHDHHRGHIVITTLGALYEPHHYDRSGEYEPGSVRQSIAKISIVDCDTELSLSACVYSL